MTDRIVVAGLAAAIVLLAGCAQNGPNPLVFVSTQSLGVDIGADPASAQTPRIVLGFKNNDVALVPVTTAPGMGDPIRGCYNAVKNLATVATCADVEGGADNGKEDESALPRKGEGKPAAPKTTAKPVAKPGAKFGAKSGGKYTLFGGSLLAVPLDPLPKQPATPASDKPQPKDKPQTTQQGQFAKAVPGTRPEGTFGQSMRDSLSVFSSFNADARVGAEGGVQLGKAFATGVAAQQLTEGINYYMQRKGEALASGPMSETNKDLMLRTECTKALIAAKDKQVPTELLPNCNEKSQQAQDELKARTACVNALAAAMEKKVPEDKLPKCS